MMYIFGCMTSFPSPLLFSYSHIAAWLMSLDLSPGWWKVAHPCHARAAQSMLIFRTHVVPFTPLVNVPSSHGGSTFSQFDPSVDTYTSFRDLSPSYLWSELGQLPKPPMMYILSVALVLTAPAEVSLARDQWLRRSWVRTQWPLRGEKGVEGWWGLT